MNYSNELQGVIAQMLKPLKGLSMKIVIEGLSGNKVIPFNRNSPHDLEVLENLKIIAENVKDSIGKNPIESKRVNEVGNKIEPIVKKELNKIGFKAETPSGKSTGYPDIEFIDNHGRLHYLECKTYNIKNIDTTQRSFYLSPSENFKVKQDAIHFGISFEVKNIGKNEYVVNNWKILDFSELELDVKYEFNSNNRKMYQQNLILAES
jgi:hypothetical protein